MGRGRTALRVAGGILVLALGVTLWFERASVRPPAAHERVGTWDGGEGPATGRAVFESCASCHMADAAGRPDGSIPRLAGQRPAILARKLRRLAAGDVDLPVMEGLARSLNGAEIDAVADFLGSLPVPSTELDQRGLPLFTAHCAACHGPVGEGNDALGAPRLSGQHAPYLARRMDDAITNARGDADPAMGAIVAGLSSEERGLIAAFLASNAVAPPGIR